jgi:hypothetical protein
MAFVKLVFRRNDRQLLGIHNVGDLAGGLIHCRVFVQVSASTDGERRVENRSIVSPACLTDVPSIVAAVQLELDSLSPRPARSRCAWLSGCYQRRCNPWVNERPSNRRYAITARPRVSILTAVRTAIRREPCASGQQRSTTRATGRSRGWSRRRRRRSRLSATWVSDV